MQLDEIMDAIAALDPLDRDQVQARLSATKDRSLDRYDRYLADALYEVTKRRVRDTQLLDRDHKIKLRKTELFDYLGDEISELREPQIQGMVSLCVRCLAEHLVNRKNPVPVTPKTLLQNMTHIGLAVDRAFPGYRKAGILHRVVRQMEVA